MFPSSPGLSLDAVDLAEFEFAGLVEISDSRVSPLGLYSFQIRADSRLADAYLFGDIRLRPALEIQVGYVFAAFLDGQAFTLLDRHYRVSLISCVCSA